MPTDEQPTRAEYYRFGARTYDLSDRPLIMGILNVTPDSFSDGGRYAAPERAFLRAREMAEEGADIIDIGGESTRPGSEAVSAKEELRRVMPVIERLAADGTVPISIDTCKAEVADEALDAGTAIVNDISGLRHDPAMADVIARHGASVVIMHMQGTPRTMQVNPVYDDVVEDVKAFLRERAAVAREAGIRQVMIDPGIGFGKTVEHNLEILRRLEEFTELGCPILVGPSRKSFIGALLDLPVDERVEGTAAAVAIAVQKGASIVRVHDVKAMRRVATVARAMRGA